MTVIMILAVDIGNTNIVIGCIEMEKVYFVERVYRFYYCICSAAPYQCYEVCYE